MGKHTEKHKEKHKEVKTIKNYKDTPGSRDTGDPLYEGYEYLDYRSTRLPGDLPHNGNNPYTCDHQSIQSPFCLTLDPPSTSHVGSPNLEGDSSTDFSLPPSSPEENLSSSISDPSSLLNSSSLEDVESEGVESPGMEGEGVMLVMGEGEQDERVECVSADHLPTLEEGLPRL